MVMYWGSYNGGYRVGVDITSTQDVPNNRSAVRIITIFDSSLSHVTNGDMQVGVVANSNQVYWWQGGATYYEGQTVVSDVTTWVNHASDGTGSVTVVAAVYGGFGGLPNVSVTVSTLSLPTIARATTPSWSGNFEAGAAKTISLPRADSSYVHDVTYNFGGASGTIATGAGVSASWTPPWVLLQQIPSTTSGTGTIHVVTKHAATNQVIGTRSVPYTLVAPSGIVPTVSSVAWDDNNPVVKSAIGAFVQGLSQIKGAVSAAGIYGSSIVSRQVVIGGTIVAENTPFTIEGSGTVIASGRATDSRVRVGTLPANFYVYPYQSPRLGANGWIVRRSNSGGTVEDGGQNLRLDLHAIVSSLIVGGVQKNNLTVRVRTRPVGGAWTNRNVIVGALVYNTWVLITGGAAYVASQSYEVEISLEDKTGVTPTKLTTIVPTAAVTLDLHATYVGVGKYREQGALDIAGHTYTSGRFFQGGDIVAKTLSELTSGILTAGASAGVNQYLILYGESSGTMSLAVTPDGAGHIWAGNSALYVGASGAGNTFIGAISAITIIQGTSVRSNNYHNSSGGISAPRAMAAGVAAVAASGITTVTFPVGRFTTIPIVTANTIGNVNDLAGFSQITARTAASFSVRAFTVGGAQGAATIDWIAVQMTLASASG